jgi:hypothetical protein
MILLADEAQVEARSSPFEDTTNLDAKRTIGSEIILVELLGDVGHVESCFVPFGDSVSVSAG